MKTITASLLTALVANAAAKDGRTFAVLRFQGDGPLTEGQVDPIVNPGATSPHLHTVMGGSNFAATLDGQTLLQSKCTNAKIKNDKSNYWVPSLFFQDPNNGSFTKVPMFYMNVYYFFEGTDDEIKAFPTGLKIVEGNAKTRNAPAFGGGSNLDPSAGPIQSIQWTCPRKSYEPASYPGNSDGSTAGMQDPNNKGAGAGFPFYPCDGYASPLRQDIHFPSCYNPKVGLDDYENNMQFPTSAPGGKQNCPSGWIHTPHIFFEVYWNTPLFDGLWTPDGKSQPFVLSNGDATGYSSHGDFFAAWDEPTLQRIIDTCNAGDIGMDNCPDIPGGLNDDNHCKIASPIANVMNIALPSDKLPGNNPVTGWGKGGVSSGTDSGSSSGSGSGSGSNSATSSSVASKVSSTAADIKSSIVAGGKNAAATPVDASSAFNAAATPVDASSAFNAADVPQSPEITMVPVITTEVNGNIKTIWDIVTVTQYTTIYARAEPTPAAKCHLGHMARHKRHGRS